ncbi:hypothetical protein SAMN05216332_10212 [Nitrosospira briensis]|nr:hypothetical protein SAMN05216332_10212 [Nitrosospira briensis]
MKSIIDETKHDPLFFEPADDIRVVSHRLLQAEISLISLASEQVKYFR